MSDVPDKALLLWGHPNEHISKPVAAKIEPYLPNVPYKEPDIPRKELKNRIGTPLDVDPKKVMSLAQIVDFPVYGGIAKGLGLTVTGAHTRQLPPNV